MKKQKQEICARCNKTIVTPDGSVGTGYGTNKDNKKICYSCCAELDKAEMRKSGRIALYLTTNENTGCYVVTNWPGTLSFHVDLRTTGRHNIAGKRYDVWFTFESQQWHGVTYGDNTEICHCKRSKVSLEKK